MLKSWIPFKHKAANDHALHTKQKYAGKVSYEAPKCLFFSSILMTQKPEGPWWFFIVGLLVLLHCPALSCINSTTEDGIQRMSKLSVFLAGKWIEDTEEREGEMATTLLQTFLF